MTIQTNAYAPEFVEWARHTVAEGAEAIALREANGGQITQRHHDEAKARVEEAEAILAAVQGDQPPAA